MHGLFKAPAPFGPLLVQPLFMAGQAATTGLHIAQRVLVASRKVNNSALVLHAGGVCALQAAVSAQADRRSPFFHLQFLQIAEEVGGADFQWGIVVIGAAFLRQRLDGMALDQLFVKGGWILKKL